MKTAIAKYLGALGLGAVLALSAAASSFAQRHDELHTAVRQLGRADRPVLLTPSDKAGVSPRREPGESRAPSSDEGSTMRFAIHCRIVQFTRR